MNANPPLEGAATRKPAVARRGAGFGLGARVLSLVACFSLLAEIAIYVPAIARFRDDWLRDRLAAAHTAALVFAAARSDMVPEDLAKSILSSVGARMLVLKTKDTRRLLAVPDMPPKIDEFYDPRTAGGGRVMFHQTMDKYGRAYHEALAKQAPAFSRDYGEAARRVARGEFALYIPLIFSQIEPLKGLPVRYVIPEDGVTYGSYSVSILKNAQHPNAARLLADFYLTDEVQALYARTGHGIVIDGLVADLSPEARELANVKPLVAEDFTRIEAYLALAKEIYG